MMTMMTIEPASNVSVRSVERIQSTHRQTVSRRLLRASGTNWELFTAFWVPRPPNNDFWAASIYNTQSSDLALYS